MQKQSIQTIVSLSAMAILAFAANSVLCRMALGPPRMDPATFSSIRVSSGALALVCLVLMGKHPFRLEGDLIGALALFLYAVPFSFAYSRLTTGTGALILFGSVQITMMIAALFAGERLSSVQWGGLAIACGGLVWLVLPGVEAPSLRGAALMALAGAAWGVYSLRGRSVRDALASTAGNFVRAAPMALAVNLARLDVAEVSGAGVALAAASGAFASGIGYAIWYRVLPSLRASQAASVQLLVPVVAAVGGTVFLGESLGLRLLSSGLAILGGVWLALGRRRGRGPGSPDRDPAHPVSDRNRQ